MMQKYFQNFIWSSVSRKFKLPKGMDIKLPSQLHLDTTKKERYKIAFSTPFEYSEWNMIPFGLKNVLSKFQHIMNDMFNDYLEFPGVYTDDVLIIQKI